MKNYELAPGEEVIKRANGDCWETPCVHSQVPGSYTFTDKRIIFIGSGAFEKLRVKFDVPYSEIESIEPYRVVFFNTGIRLWMKNGDRYRLSLRKRGEYMEIINKFIN